MDLKDKEVILEFVCPWCRLKCGVIRGTVDDFLGVFHPMPMCTEYDVMDPLVFITEVRKHYEKEIEEGRGKPN